MATRNIVPRANNEGKLGTSEKKWAEVNAITFNGSLSGNATSSSGAAKLTTARTISLSGDATGSVSFNGSSNVSIPVTLARTTGLTDLIPDGAAAHNCLYRGKDITADFNSGKMSTNIANGTFRDIFVGDYIDVPMTVNGTSIGNVVWRVAHCDYFLHHSDANLTTHHIVMVPDDILNTNIRMAASNTSVGGYLATEMWKTTLPLYTNAIQNAFGSAHVLSHRELLTNAISETAASTAGSGWVGSSSGWAWADVVANIMSEPMVYGGTVFSSSGFDVGNRKTQLALFNLCHDRTIAGYRGNHSDRKWYWLSAVASSTRFANAGSDGDANCFDASRQSGGGGIRPYFLLR